MPYNEIKSIVIDDSGNKWIGTWDGGLAVFNKEGVVLGLENSNSGSQIANQFVLSQNYPNPFNPSTTISYSLLEAAQVKLTVYNSLGQKVRTLVNAWVVAGSHTAVWNGLNDASVKMTSGIYIYRFEAGDYLKVQKMLLLR